MARIKSETAAAQLSATIGFKTELFLAAAKLSDTMDDAEYKCAVASELAATA
jgi:hypothetical protein